MNVLIFYLNLNINLNVNPNLIKIRKLTSMNIGYPFIDDDQCFGQNSQSTLFILNEKIRRPLYETIPFLSEDFKLDNISSNIGPFPMSSEKYNILPYCDSNEGLDEGMTSKQDMKMANFQDYALEMSELINKNFSKSDQKNKKAIQEEFIRKPRAFTDINSTRKKCINRKKAKLDSKIIQNSPNYLIKNSKIQKNIDKKKIFKITHEFMQNSSLPISNFNLDKTCKVQKLMDSTGFKTPEKLLSSSSLSEQRKPIFSIQRKITDKEQIFNINRLNCSNVATDFPNSHEILVSPHLVQAKNLGYICMENIKLNFELEDQLFHLKLFQEDSFN